MSDVEKYLEALRQRATLQPESGPAGPVVSETVACPTCKTPLSEQHQIGPGDRAAVMANLGIMEVKLRCPGCNTVSDVTLPRGYEWNASIDIPGWGTFPVQDSTPNPPSGGVPAAWYADPLGRHQYRYWDGASWTHHVADDGKTSLDPLEERGSPTEETGPTPSSDASSSRPDEPVNYPDPHSLEDLLPAVAQWMDSASPVSDPARLSAFMDDVASTWHTSWRRGSREEVYRWFQECAALDAGKRAVRSNVIKVEWGGDPNVAAYWTRYGALGSMIEPEVCAYLHFIGKASDEEFFYLAHR